ncbi:putative hydrolase of the HAD superfamily [Rhizobium aquaticum]|uniref:Hydrolase of the HAD superfamily n=1 Tax=Rhizobium aquaticum TaxID=1549636 RepID=A0ABV2J8F5_9HYPH
MTLTNFKILTFDVVGTIIDFETGIVNYIQPIAAQAGLSLDDQAIVLAYGKAEGIEHERTPGLPFTDMMAPCYIAMAAELGLPTDNASRDGFRLSIPKWPAFPDSIAALKRLAKHYRLVAMTNSDNWAFGCFAETLNHPFHDKVTAEDVESCKPDPLFFGFARGLQFPHGLRLADYLHVAQSQYHDIGVAQSLGYKTCWIQRRKGLDGYGASPTPQQVTVPDYHFSALIKLADAADSAFAK